MSDMITVADPGWDWSFWPYTGIGVIIIGAAALLCLLASRLSSTRSVAEGWHQAFKVIGIIALVSIVVGGTVNACISANVYNNTIGQKKMEGLWNLGYHEVEFDSDDDYLFTAYKDGEYVKGVAVEVVPLTWQVIQLDIPDVKK